MGINKSNSRQYINPEGIKGWKKYLPLINITLLVGVITLGVIGTFLFRAVPSPLTGLERLKTKTPPQEVSVPTIQTNTAPLEEYDLLTNENPFAPSRKEWELPRHKAAGHDAQKQAEAQAPPKVPPKGITLHGIAIIDNLKKALVRNPDPAKHGVAPFLYIEEGSDVGDYKVKSIESDQIRLVWEGEESIVKIFADKDNVRTLPSPGAIPFTPPQQPQPPRPEARSRPPHELQPRRHPRTEEEDWDEEEEEDWDEEEEEDWDEEEEGEEWSEGEEEGYERLDAGSRSHQPKRPFRRSRGG